MAETRDLAGPRRSEGMRLGRRFFERPTLAVARDLLGRRLVRVRHGRRLAGRIVEVEAYVGPEDTACHARHGMTQRNRVMFGPPGYAYVYFTYGMHHMLNLVTERPGFPAAVLIRALEPEEGVEAMLRLRRGSRRGGIPRAGWLAGGPARLCQALAVTLALNGEDVAEGDRLFLEEGRPVRTSRLQRTPRIGIDYAAERDRRAEWRFICPGSPHLSR